MWLYALRSRTVIEEGKGMKGIHPPLASFFLFPFFIPQVEKETREEMKVYGKPDNLSLAEDWTAEDGGREAGLSDEPRAHKFGVTWSTSLHHSKQ